MSAPKPPSPKPKSEPEPGPSVLIARIIGAALALYGLGTLLFTARNLSRPTALAPEGSVFAEIVHNLAWLDLVFGAGLLALGIAIALRRAWTRGVDWMSCLVLMLLIPTGFNLLGALLGDGKPNLARSLVTLSVLAALLIAAAVWLYRNPPPSPALPPNTRAVRPRVTFMSRALGVLLILAGLVGAHLALGSKRAARTGAVGPHIPAAFVA